MILARKMEEDRAIDESKLAREVALNLRRGLTFMEHKKCAKAH